MAASDVDMQRLVVSLEAQVNKFQKAMDGAAKVADTKATQIERRFRKSNDVVSAGMGSVGRSALAASVASDRLLAGMAKFGGTAQLVRPVIGGFNQLPPTLTKTTAALKNATANMIELGRAGGGVGSALGGIGAALGVSSVIEYANAWTRVNRSLDASGRVFGVALKPAAELNALANDARVDVEAYSKLYIRTSAAIRDYGFEAGTAEKVTSTLAKALKLGGAAASEQASVLLQFSQALQKGKLDGDEFRSVMENAGVVQELLADRLRVTKGEIIKMASEGKLQIRDLIGAMVDGGDRVDRIFRQMPATIDEAYAVLRNNVIQFLGEADKASGASKAIADGLVAIGNNLETISIIAGALLGSATLRLAAFAAATVAASNPVSLLAAAIGALATGYVALGDKVPVSRDGLISLQGAVSAFIDVVSGQDEVEKFNASLDRMTDAQRKAAIATREHAEEQQKSIGYFDGIEQAAQSAINKLSELAASGDKGGGPLADWIEGTKELASWIGQLTGLSALAEMGLKTMDAAAERARTVALQKGVEEANFGQGLQNYRDGKVSDKRPVPGPTSGDTKRSVFERETAEIKKRTEALKAEIATIGESTFAQTKAKVAAELRAAASETASKQNRKVTADELAAIDKLATAYAGAQAQAAFLESLQSQRDHTRDLRDEIDLIGLQGQELERAKIQQQLLNDARRAGQELTPGLLAQIDAIADQNSALAHQISILNDIRDQSAEALKAFISDMREGKSATEALGNALDRMADKLIDMAVDGLVESALGGLKGGGSGGTGGGLLSLFGFAKGGVAANGKPVSLPTFARGGVSKSAAIFGEAGPEAAVPLPDGRRIPVDLRIPSAPSATSAPTAGPVEINFAPVFQVQGEQVANTIRTDVVPQLKKMVQQEIVETLTRKERFAKLGAR